MSVRGRTNRSTRRGWLGNPGGLWREGGVNTALGGWFWSWNWCSCGELEQSLSTDVEMLWRSGGVRVCGASGRRRSGDEVRTQKCRHCGGEFVLKESRVLSTHAAALLRRFVGLGRVKSLVHGKELGRREGFE